MRGPHRLKGGHCARGLISRGFWRGVTTAGARKGQVIPRHSRVSRLQALRRVTPVGPIHVAKPVYPHQLEQFLFSIDGLTELRALRPVFRPSATR